MSASRKTGMRAMVVEEGQREAVEILFFGGAELNIEDSRGRTALDIALGKSMQWNGIRDNDERRQKEIENYRAIIEILRKHGAD
ncbi:MAG: hypothetical protein AB2L14_00160 [Candidatus Xenobiia bacterium LiM19]